MKTTKVFNGLTFSENTSIEVMNILSATGRGQRIRFWYGDWRTGKCWNDENDICGYIGRSCGTEKIPILLNKRNSTGGGGILTDCILKIVDTKTKAVLYEHPLFVQPLFSNVGVNVFCNGERFGSNKTEQLAKRFCDFMNGKRMNK